VKFSSGGESGTAGSVQGVLLVDDEDRENEGDLIFPVLTIEDLTQYQSDRAERRKTA